MDVPNPNDEGVLEFATGAKLAGAADDVKFPVTRQNRQSRAICTRQSPANRCDLSTRVAELRVAWRLEFSHNE
jgi:hypothetical protein